MFTKDLNKVICTECPIYKKYGENCFAKNSLFHIINRAPYEKCIVAAEKIRDCILPWKNRRTNMEE